MFAAGAELGVVGILLGSFIFSISLREGSTSTEILSQKAVNHKTTN